MCRHRNLTAKTVRELCVNESRKVTHGDAVSARTALFYCQQAEEPYVEIRNAGSRHRRSIVARLATRCEQ